MSSDAIHVAAGVILDGQHRVLLACRPEHKHQGGLWEFPGGKVEPGEQVAQALSRELFEELHIAVRTSAPLLRVEHDYGDKRVLLDVWLVTAFTGEPQGREGQRIAWVAVSELASYDFPAANSAIVQAVQQLPCHLAQTDK